MKIEIPTQCPVCNSTLEMINEQLFCKNDSCSAKSLKSLLHYTKTLKILGLGEKTLEKLNFEDINELYSYSLKSYISTLGEKIGTKIYNEIYSKNKLSIGTFISAFGISLVGKSAGEKLDKALTSIDDLNSDLCKKAGLGTIATDNLMDWYIDKYDKYRDLPIEFIVVDSTEQKNSLTVCISGKVPGYTKAKLKTMLLASNVVVKDSVIKSLDYLISNETGTTKVKKAEQYNINIISFENFMEKINEHT